VANRLREVALPAPFGADTDGVHWFIDADVEIGLSSQGWIGSRRRAVEVTLAANQWPEPPNAAAEWAVALAIAQRSSRSTFAGEHEET
jgi:uncharacterized membrane protein